MNRREFLLSLAAAGALPGCREERASGLPPGGFVGPSFAIGHRLRGHDFPPPSATRHVGVAIVGGGVGGLSAAWKMTRAGFRDFRLFELEAEVGGNARHGENAVSRFPWGAHYLPLPGREARAVRELLADLGVLHGDLDADKPRYEERFLCFAPQERLYRNGKWQEGLVPQSGVSAQEQAQFRRFFELIAALRQQRGQDGRRAFALPMALSSRDPALLALDRIDMRAWLLQHGLDAAPLHWYVNYACRDDYGTDYAQTSAWAGLHYYCSRDGRAQDAESDQVLTWPEGNGWLVTQLQQRLLANLTTAALAHRIETTRDGIALDVLDLRSNATTRWHAKQLIFASPAFVLPHLCPALSAAHAAAARSVTHAPWLVANLTLRELPPERGGATLAWDNVLYDSAALGYVVATHQSLRTQPGPTVLTYYWALTHAAPEVARKQLFDIPWSAWAQRILADLERPHPGIGKQVERLDIMRWAHAMARPTPGAIWHAQRQVLQQGLPRLHVAHADASGFSIFEEANYRGVGAAERAMNALGVRHHTSL
jgi:protoporphyrinogen oxidase